jgi:YD repeat-containing protein
MKPALAFPIVSKAGRGIDFNYTLHYDSTIWVKNNSSWILTPRGANGSAPIPSTFPMAGWTHGVSGAVGNIYYTTVTGFPPCNSGGKRYQNYVWVDPNGTRHSFNNAWVSINCGLTLEAAVADDMSGLTIWLNTSNPHVATIITPGGVHYYVSDEATGTSTSASLIDNNGNKISSTPYPSGGSACQHSSPKCVVITDTLGASALTASYNSSNALTYVTYTNPLGLPADVSITYAPYTVQTTFGCAGVSEYPATSASLIDRITYPDGNYYRLAYETTPGYANSVTGRIASITLPTGGTISYTYTGTHDGMDCASGTTIGFTKTTPDGTWTYSRDASGQAWDATVTTVTDPAGNQTVYNFEGVYGHGPAYITQKQVYQGSTSGARLENVVICYNGNFGDCNNYRVTLPISRRTITKQLGTSAFDERDVYYNVPGLSAAYGLISEDDEYDFGASSPIRKTLITYRSPDWTSNILNRPATVTVQDGSGNQLSQVSYSYDGTAVTPTSGTPQLVAVSGSRGNLTTVSSAGLSTRYTYFDTGNVQTKTDANGAQVTFTYGACGNSFPTVISEPLGLSSSMTWNCTGAVMTSVTDENGQTATSVFNDPYFWRVNQLQDQLGNNAYMTYTSPTQYSASMAFNGGNSIDNGVKTLDSLGRSHLSQTQQAPGSSNYDSTEVDYSWALTGWQVKNILPFSASLGGTNPNGPAVTTAYDALGRPVSVSDSGGGSVTYSYSLNDVLQTVGPAPSGENAKQRQTEYNALGWLTSVCEITSTQPGGGSACNQNTAATGFKTTWGYDAAGTCCP